MIEDNYKIVHCKERVHRLLMVRTVEEFYADAQYVTMSMAYLKSIQKQVGEALKEGEQWDSLN